MPKITPKQQQFCNEYLIDLNAKQAAIRAGYSPKTANEQGSRLLTNVNVQKELQRRLEKKRENSEVTQSDILAKLVKIGFKSFEDTEIAPKDSLKALELICRLLGLDKVPQSVAENNLFDAINNTVKGEYDDLQELQQTTTASIDVVE